MSSSTHLHLVHDHAQLDAASEPVADMHIHMRVDGLSVAYGGTAVIDDITLDFGQGRVTALVGPSGCGKTSLLWALNRLTDLMPGATVRGRIRFEGDEVLDQGLDVLALRRRVGMIAQRPNPFPLSIRRNFELPLREHGARRRDEIEGRMERALRNVGLWAEVQDRLNAPALALSGGQQQRLCIARALVLEPSMLLMDEPCSALDPMASGVVEDLIDSLRGRYTVAIVTHNLAQARRLADDVAVFWTDRQVGKLVEFGACEQLFKAPRDPLTAAYLSGARG